MSEIDKFIKYMNKEINEKGLRGLSAVTFIDKNGIPTGKTPMDALISKQNECILETEIFGVERKVPELEDIAKELNNIFGLFDSNNNGKGFKPYTDDYDGATIEQIMSDDQLVFGDSQKKS